MVSSSAEPADGGYATAAAMTICMAISVTAAALTSLAVADLKSARGDLARLEAERRIAGAEHAAALALMKTDKPVRLAWTLVVDDGAYRVLAEPEAAKLGYAAASALTADQLVKLGASDPAQLRALMTMAATASSPPTWVGDLDPGSVWRRCASSLISRFGTARTPALTAPTPPGERGLSWRLGEVWRVEVSSPDGWREDRIMRFTGDPLRPAAILDRRFYRHTGREPSCATAFAA